MAAPHSPPASPPEEPSAQHDNAQVPYDDAFTDALMQTILEAPSSESKKGKILFSPAFPRSNPEGSIRLEDVDASSLPDIDPSELPLPLTDERRKFESSLPGLRLTHPGGSFAGGSPPKLPSGVKPVEGGPGSVPPDLQEYVQQIARRHNIKTVPQLKKFMTNEAQRQRDELRRRMESRKQKIEERGKIDR